VNGLTYVIDKLGESLAAAEQEIARLRQENAILREQLQTASKKSADES
jgi:cell division protein FtsB